MKKLFLLAFVCSLTLSSRLAPNAYAQQALKSWLSSQDTNGDERIAKDEATGLMKRFFDRNDLNQDGFLDKQELQDLVQRLAQSGKRKTTKSIVPDSKVQSQVPENVEAVLNVRYREGDPAWALDLFYRKKVSSSPQPAIVFVHGGGWRNGDKRAANFIGPAIKYASKGYVTVTVNYRLDGKILPCVHDVKCAVRWLRANATTYNIDPERIGAYGNSAGAHLVCLLGLSHTEPSLEGDGPWQDFSSAVQAVVASATPTRPVFGTGDEETKKLVAPMTYVSKNAPPMLLFHDEADRTVPVDNSDSFAKALKGAGVADITYKRYNNQSGHGVFSRNISETAPQMEAFFARTLRLDRKDD